MCFVLDASGSVEYYWSTLLFFVIDVVKVINVGRDGTHIGVVTFGEDAQLIFRFTEFIMSTDYEMSMIKKIESIQGPILFSRTFINRGLRTANREVLREEYGMRPDAKQVRAFCKSVSLCLPLCPPTPLSSYPPVSPCICVLKEHSQLVHVRIRYHFIANLHITETRFILFLTKYDKIIS